MSNKPSWLDDEEVQSRTANAAVKVASNSSVQKAVINAAAEETGPAWAKSSYKPPGSPTSGVNPAADPEVGRQSSVANVDEPTKFECPPEELKGMNTMRYVLAFFYLASAINLAVASGLSLVGATDVGRICFALYIIFFSAILCCYEIAFGVSFICICIYLYLCLI